jgi:hypothetical protein
MKMVRFGTMKKLSETYKELGIAFTFPIEITNEKGNSTYYENSYGYWWRREHDKDGNETYSETSCGDWRRREYDKNGKVTYYEDSDGDIVFEGAKLLRNQT